MFFNKNNKTEKKSCRNEARSARGHLVGPEIFFVFQKLRSRDPPPPSTCLPVRASSAAHNLRGALLLQKPKAETKWGIRIKIEVIS